MECQRPASLFVLTLLQLCRAEHIPPQWYSAKINNGYPPQPISEVFTSETPFSTANPIVVSQKISNSISDKIDLLSSTLSPPNIQSESTKLTQKTVLSTPISMPAGALYQQLNLEELNPFKLDVLPRQQNVLQPNMPLPASLQLIPQNMQKQLMEPQLVTEFPTQVTRNINVLPQKQIEQTYTPNLPLLTLFQVQTQTRETQPTSTQLPTLAVSNQPLLPSSFAPPNGYFLVYQPQAPQSIPSLLPASGPGISNATIREFTPTTVTLPPLTSEVFSTTLAPPITSILTTTPLPSTTRLPTTPLPISTLSSSSVTVTPSSTLGLSTGGCISSTTAIPRLLLNRFNNKATGIAYTYPLTIRVIAPTGSITNLNLNPLMTTKRPVTISSTRKPTTRRTSKPKKNNYDRCLDGCRKVRDPICAAPLSHLEIDPKTLKGFPSVCHMACHNSYRKTPFEKVIEGNCSRLRTQIRLIDSRNKLKRDELRKTQYLIDQGQNTVIELTSLT